jgi:[calcium/calmodulin-dependent protein kinase] kinase
MEYSQFNQYIIVKDLGVGVHAKVALGLHIQENLLYAIKVSHRNAAVAETAVRKEIAILKKLNHKNVLKLYEVIDDQKTNELLLVLEYASSGPIFTRYDKRPLREPLIHRYIRDVLQGLDYLHHAAGIAHMDLKPENLLLMADGSVKIADFGVSFIGQSKAVNSNKKIVGTPAFIAPEMLGEDGYDPYIADIWSLGVCIFHMATAELPFIGRTIFQIVAMAQRQGLRFPPEAVVLSRRSHEASDTVTDYDAPLGDREGGATLASFFSGSASSDRRHGGRNRSCGSCRPSCNFASTCVQNRTFSGWGDFHSERSIR